MKEDINDLYSKYKKRIELELGTKTVETPNVLSREYKQFKDEIKPRHLTFYEKACRFSEKIIKIKPDKKKEELLQESISIAHLDITPTGAASFGILVPLTIMVIGSVLSFAIFQSFFFIFFFLIISVSLIGPLGKLAIYTANSWRLKASNQMVLCIFYIVTYMRHTSNLEGAVEFAADHLSPPLSLDLKKVLWDVETEKYSTIKESVDNYLESWKKWNFEFIESFHLVESSLYEGSEDKRLASLDRALDIILSETYEKMLHYAHNLKSPITMLHMLGVILPILGLVILPLIVSFLADVKWFHLATIYNIGLPIGVYYLGKSILSTRPTGYGSTDISEEHPQFKKYKNVLFNVGNQELSLNPVYISIFIGIIFVLIGLSPIILHAIDPELEMPLGDFELIGYKQISDTIEKGPYGLGASLLSIFIPIGIGLAVGIYCKLRSKNVFAIREKSKRLETEFASALFQLGNRLGDGLPVELAVGKVADTMKGTLSGNFFEIVSSNIRRLGMGVNKALFDKKYGALTFFPSRIISSSMKVLTESMKKGPNIAASALMNISRYIKEIHKVNERLTDLMADIISSMSAQIKFLTPVIAGIVVGITSMVTFIIGKLTSKMELMNSEGGDMGMGGVQSLFTEGIPTYYFQIIVGIYVVQIIYILTVLSNGIQNGADKLGERYELGNNIIRSTLLYSVIAAAVMLMFNLIASSILESGIGGM
ncbi:MAG: hypothetical protein ABIC04_03910 [Nanoarchaeota archaeon]